MKKVLLSIMAIGDIDSVNKVLADEDAKIKRLHSIKEANTKALLVQDGLHVEASAKEQREYSELLNKQLREREEIKRTHRVNYKEREDKLKAIQTEIVEANKHIKRLTY